MSSYHLFLVIGLAASGANASTGSVEEDLMTELLEYSASESDLELEAINLGDPNPSSTNENSTAKEKSDTAQPETRQVDSVDAGDLIKILPKPQEDLPEPMQAHTKADTLDTGDKEGAADLAGKDTVDTQDGPVATDENTADEKKDFFQGESSVDEEANLDNVANLDEVSYETTKSNPEEATLKKPVEIEAVHDDSTSVVSQLTSGSQIVKNQYKIRFGVGFPTFSGVNHYEDLYNSAGNMTNFMIDYYPWGFGYPIGVGVHFGYYRDTGSAARSRQPAGTSYETTEIDHDQEINLVLIPFQLNAVSQWAMFSDFVVLNFWGGLEMLAVQESRTPSNLANNAEQESYVNAGTDQGVNFGLGFGFRIDKFDSRTQWSLRTMGLKSILFEPYIRIAKASSKKMGDFSRTTFGFLFSFESL